MGEEAEDRRRGWTPLPVAREGKRGRCRCRRRCRRRIRSARKGRAGGIATTGRGRKQGEAGTIALLLGLPRVGVSVGSHLELICVMNNCYNVNILSM